MHTYAYTHAVYVSIFQTNTCFRNWTTILYTCRYVPRGRVVRTHPNTQTLKPKPNRHNKRPLLPSVSIAERHYLTRATLEQEWHGSVSPNRTKSAWTTSLVEGRNLKVDDFVLLLRLPWQSSGVQLRFRTRSAPMTLTHSSMQVLNPQLRKV